MDNLLNIYHINEGSRALGPGLRFIIWVQGCLQRCQGCITPQSRPLSVCHLISVERLADAIINNKGIEGITISGGEPFLQASKLTQLLEMVRQKRPELNVIVFSGYTFDRLAKEEKAKTFMQHIDLLIDGPYKDEKNDGKGLRGSSNQKLHFLTDRLLPYKEELENGGRSNEIYVSDESVITIGIPRKETNKLISEI